MISRISVFSAIEPFRDRGRIDMLPERHHADPTHGVDETLIFDAVAHIDLQDAFDHLRHLMRGERRSDDLADRAVLALGSANRNLIPLGAILGDAENADAADMMMAAGIDAS